MFKFNQCISKINIKSPTRENLGATTTFLYSLKKEDKYDKDIEEGILKKNKGR